MYKAGINLSDNFTFLYETILFSPIYRPKLKQAALLKLGCMLAVTDELAYTAEKSGTPIPADYRPPDENGIWYKNWQAAFGKPMPTIEGLFDEALTVFHSLVDPNDLTTLHLLTLQTKKYFLR